MTHSTIGLSEHDALARIFRTLGDPNRLRVVDVLGSAGEASQAELVRLLGMGQSRVSEHMLILTWSGLVESRKEGRATVYRLSGDHSVHLVQTARRFLREHDQAVGGNRVVVEEGGNRIRQRLSARG